jgi:putative serine protease PepD
MHNIDRNMMPPQPPQSPWGPGPVPPTPSPREPSRGLRAGAIMALALIIASVFAIGLFAGWEFGQSSTTAPPQTNSAPAIPPASSGSNDAVREAVIARVRPAVVQVNVTTQSGQGLGSGVIIDKRGYIITNNHVIDGAQQIEVKLSSGKTLPAKLVGTQPSDDLAVLKISPNNIPLTVVPLGDSSQLKVGQEVLAIGNPLGITQTVTSGIVSALGRTVDSIPNAIQTDAPINPGNSGGALVNMQGQLIGIPTATAIDPEFRTPANGVGFAIPSNRVQFIAPQLINNGKVTNTGRAALGVTVTTVDSVIAQQNNLPVSQGALIVSITAKGAAAQAGLRAGDVITRIDDQDIISAGSLSDALINKQPGDSASVQFYRGSQQQTVQVKLMELPARGS